MTNHQGQTPNSLSRRLQEVTSSVERKRLIEQWAERGPEDPEVVPALLSELQIEGDEITNWAIIRALGSLYTQQPEILTALTQILDQGRPPSRRLVVEVLQQIGDRNSRLIQVLVELNQRRENDDLRICIVQILGEVGEGSKIAREELIHIINNCSSYVIRRLAVDALAQIDPGSPEAIETWLNVVRTGENYYIRYPAMMHLGRVAVGNPLVIEAFKAMIKTQGSDHRSQEIRRIAAMGLQQVNRTLSPMEDIGRALDRGESISYDDFQHYQEEQAAHIQRENIDIFLEMIDNSSTEDDIQGAVVQLTIIGEGQPRVIDRFITLLPHHRNTSLYHLIVTGLLKILTDVPEDLKDRVAAAITQEFHSGDGNLMFKSVLGSILGKIDRATPEAVEMIEDLIQSGDQIAVDSLLTMQQMGRQKVIELLNSSNDQELLTSIIASLHRQKLGVEDPAVLNGILSLLKRSEPMTVGLGIYALQLLGSDHPQILEALIGVINTHPEEEIQQMASETLSMLQDQDGDQTSATDFQL